MIDTLENMINVKAYNVVIFSDPASSFSVIVLWSHSKSSAKRISH